MKHFKKDDYLIKKIEPFKVKNVNNINDLLVGLKYCGFQGKNLANALDILEEMVNNKDCLKVLTLSGAMVPAGMGDLICVLIEKKLIDVLVTTGANISHDLVDVFTNIGHYAGSQHADDTDLFRHRINRVYDVFIPEENYKIAEKGLFKIIQDIYVEKKVFCTPSEMLKSVGEKIKTRCILSVAAKHNVPIFVPAFSDSEFALDLFVYTKDSDYEFQFDILGDLDKYSKMIREAKETGTFIIGGGVPRNWAQQIFPLLDQIEKMEEIGFNYSVRIHTAVEYDGGLSGCTISESKSWGKYHLDSKYVSVWCDATIALPILVTGLLQRLGIT